MFTLTHREHRTVPSSRTLLGTVIGHRMQLALSSTSGLYIITYLNKNFLVVKCPPFCPIFVGFIFTHLQMIKYELAPS